MASLILPLKDKNCIEKFKCHRSVNTFRLGD